MFHRLIIFLLMTFFPVYALAQTENASPQWRDSLDVLREKIAKLPYSSDLHLRKAAVNIELGQWEYAADEYSFVLEKEPDNLAALYYRAYVNTHLRRYALACVDYEHFLKIAPYNLEARLGLSYVLQKQGRMRDALDHANRLVELCPDSAIVYATRAALEKTMQSYEPALYDWDEAIRLAPDNTDYMLSKVDILLLLGRKEESKTLLDTITTKGVPRGLLREWYEKCR